MLRLESTKRVWDKWADTTMIKKSSKWIEDEVLEDYGDIIWPNIVKDFQQDMEV